MISEELSIRRLLNVVQCIRSVDPTMPIQGLAALLTIAIEEGQNINSVADKTAMAQSAASRNISSLTDWDWRKKPGLNLVEYRTDPMNLSQKTLYLTDKGRSLIQKIVAVKEGEMSTKETV